MKSYQIKILVVEDEDFLRNLLRISLEKEGYGVRTACNGVEALDVYNATPPDLVLLDIMMPYMDGFEVCRELRKRSDVPIVMLTALNSPDDAVRGFDVGADDFITKPFTFREVSARIQAILRRVMWARERPVFQIMTIGEIQLNDEVHEVTVRNKLVHLTPIEYQLLRYLMNHSDRPIAKDTLFREVWGYDFTGGTNLVEVAMRRLREKIEKNPSTPEYLLTVRGAGYKFATPAADAAQTAS